MEIVKEDFCLYYPTLEQAKQACECSCEEPIRGGAYYRCNYGNCNGYHCELCGKFIIIE